eukprot:m.48365 g.48365  ORF g.48365 m.48365 type:complete len:400 (-) comp10565_c0_seq2:1085-2284(-)
MSSLVMDNDSTRTAFPHDEEMFVEREEDDGMDILWEDECVSQVFPGSGTRVSLGSMSELIANTLSRGNQSPRKQIDSPQQGPLMFPMPIHEQREGKRRSPVKPAIRKRRKSSVDRSKLQALLDTIKPNISSSGGDGGPAEVNKAWLRGSPTTTAVALNTESDEGVESDLRTAGTTSYNTIQKPLTDLNLQSGKLLTDAEKKKKYTKEEIARKRAEAQQRRMNKLRSQNPMPKSQPVAQHAPRRPQQRHPPPHASQMNHRTKSNDVSRVTPSTTIHGTNARGGLAGKPTPPTKQANPTPAASTTVANLKTNQYARHNVAHERIVREESFESNSTTSSQELAPRNNSIHGNTTDTNKKKRYTKEEIELKRKLALSRRRRQPPDLGIGRKSSSESFSDSQPQ